MIRTSAGADAVRDEGCETGASADGVVAVDGPGASVWRVNATASSSSSATRATEPAAPATSHVRRLLRPGSKGGAVGCASDTLETCEGTSFMEAGIASGSVGLRRVASSGSRRPTGVGASGAPSPGEATVRMDVSASSSARPFSISAMRRARASSSPEATRSTQSPISAAEATPKTASSSCAISRAVAKRSAGSRWSPFITTRSSAGGKVVAMELGGATAAPRTFARTLPSFSPLKRRSPVSASQSTTDAA